MELNLAPYQSLVNLVHVLAAMAFVLVHGFTGLMAVRLRGERDRERIETMVKLSDSFLGWGWLALLVLFSAGILSGIAGAWWTSGKLWIWVSLAVFIGVGILMTPIASTYMIAVRRGLGQATPREAKKGLPAPEPAFDVELTRILSSSRPVWAALIGGAGIAVLTWLMMSKPF